MKIAVVNNCVPFLEGGAEHLARALSQEFLARGHESVVIRIPFNWESPQKILESMLACRLLTIPNVDRVIALKFPAYLIPHSNKVLWLLHQFRQAYDFWGTEFQGIPNTPEGLRLRDSVHRADDRYLPEARRIFTNSYVTSNRLKNFNGINSEVLWPPLLSTSHFSSKPAEDFVFYPSRVNATKRQWLAVESMRFVKSPVRLILGGKPETPEEENRIDAIIRENKLEQRVEWDRSFMEEGQKADFLSRALGTLYLPYDEDSYGYVTLESFASRKPVITCTDSGGVDVVVKDGITGLIAKPEPRAIAEAIDRLHQDKTAAAKMGAAGNRLVEELGITWDHVIEMLTQ